MAAQATLPVYYAILTVLMGPGTIVVARHDGLEEPSYGAPSPSPASRWVGVRSYALRAAQRATVSRDR